MKTVRLAKRQYKVSEAVVARNRAIASKGARSRWEGHAPKVTHTIRVNEEAYGVVKSIPAKTRIDAVSACIVAKFKGA